MKTDDISFRFNADSNIVADAGNRLWRYYNIHKLVYDLLTDYRYMISIIRIWNERKMGYCRRLI